MAFSKVLVANRGEIAVRVMRTAKALGYRTVAVYSEADAGALHVQYADEAVCIGPAKVSDSYLKIENILEAARLTGADAIHPGYGFLSENAEFAKACVKAGITFIGPTPEAIELMGSKRLSKIAMLEANVPCIPGYQGGNQDLDNLVAEGKKIGFPLMVKASAGGGGRGMRLVHVEGELKSSIETAQSEALNAFGSSEMILERAVIAPRHVEIQVFGDTLGNHVYLFERDCSIQRRNQKVVEEAPCPVMTPDLRQRMGEAAVAAAKSCGYVGAGTVEFLLDSQGHFYFLEMNTRLQVEHPVTELITGLDLVEWQLRVANGEKLPLAQDELTLTGHAVEVRLYAEDPGTDFLPQTGEILLWKPADLPNVRVDHGMMSLGEVSPHYDSMIAKVIAYGKTRTDAVRLLARALEDTVLLGVNSNKQFLVNLLKNPVLVSGDTNTAFIPTHFAQDPSLKPAFATHEALAVAASLLVYQPKQEGWHTGVELPIPLNIQVNELIHKLSVDQNDQTFTLAYGDQSESLTVLSRAENELVYIWQGVRKAVAYVQRRDTIYLDMANGNLTLVDVTHAPPASADEAGDGQIRAPMNGAVVNILVKEGDKVVKDQTLVILEAMKIQQQIKSNCDGVVGAISATVGLQVKKRQVLLQVSTD